MLIDHAGNCLTHGLPIHFEVPDLTAQDYASRHGRRKKPRMVACTHCGAAMEPAQFTCPACGIDRPAPLPNVRIIDGELVEYGSLAEGDKPSVEANRDTYRQLLWYAREHRHPDGWAYYRYRDRFNEKPPWSWKAMEPLPPSPGLLRWIKSRNIAWAKSGRRHAG